MLERLPEFVGNHPVLSLIFIGLVLALIFTEIARRNRGFVEVSPAGLTQLINRHDALLIDVDLCLSPDHPLYEKPRPAEGACFRPALLEFPNCTRVAEKEAAATTPACAEIVAGLTHGLISSLSLVTDGEYALSGDFGTLQILADRPILRLDPRRSGPARS